MKTYKLIEIIIASFTLFSCTTNNISSETNSNLTNSSKQGESYLSINSLDNEVSFDLPYFPTDGDNYEKFIGGKIDSETLDGQHIYYSTLTNMTKSRALIKESSEYIQTKSNSENIIAKNDFDNTETISGQNEKEVIYKDGYYYFINYVTHNSNNKMYETYASASYLDGTFKVTNIQGSANQTYNVAFPFFFLKNNAYTNQIDNQNKKGQNKTSLNYTYDEINEHNLIQKFTFSSYDTVKDYYKTINKNYEVKFDDNNKQIELKSCTYRQRKDYKIGNSIAVISCTDTGISIDITFNY